MSQTECSPEENIVRAITSAHWDAKKNRYSSDLFKGEGISVSRLTISSLEELFRIFHLQLDKPPNRMVTSAGEINVGRLQSIGRNYTPSAELTVVPEPAAENPAHAEIPQKISRGLAFKIIEALIIHEDISRSYMPNK